MWSTRSLTGCQVEEDFTTCCTLVNTAWYAGAFSTAMARRWFMLSLPPTNIAQGPFNRAATSPGSLQPLCVQGLLPPQRQDICPHRISNSSCWPVLPACPGPSEQQPNPDAHQPHPEHGIICRPGRSTHPRLLCSTASTVRHRRCQDRALWYSTCYSRQSVTYNYYPLSPAMQPVFLTV